MSLGGILGGILGGAVGFFSGAGPMGAVAGFGIGSSIGGGIDSSNAASDIAQEQLEAQKQQRAQALGYAAPSMEELNLMHEQLQQFGRYNTYLSGEYERSSALMNALQPGIMDAAKQLQEGLQGKNTAFTAPIQRDIARGRSQLTSQLQNQMGSGWAGSSAGQAAMGAYNQRGQGTLQQAQLSGLGTLANLGSQMQGQYTQAQGGLNQAVGMSNNLLNNALASRSSIASRQIGALNATSITPYAGANRVGDMMMGNMMAGLGGQAFGMGLGGLMKNQTYGANLATANQAKRDYGYIPPVNSSFEYTPKIL